MESYKNGYKNISIHRLVGKAFIYNDDETKNQINHIDFDKKNNNVNNLEWVSNSENQKHNVINGRHNNGGLQKTTEESLNEIKLLLINGIKGKEIAKMYNITPSAISYIKNNKLCIKSV